MIGKVDSNNNVADNAKNISSSKSAIKDVKSANPAPVVAVRSAASIAASFGLPADKLSNSIISFVRFFSLTLKPNVLTSIRQQAFLSPANTGGSPAATAGTGVGSAVPDEQAAAKLRQALSLAAAAAESKGVELSPKGLEAFAEAVDPDWQKKRDDERKRQNREQNKHEDKKILKNESISAADLKKLANEYTGNDSITGILNRLPGKNGQRWIVLPFSFSDDGHLFGVTMRVLLDDGNKTVKMALQLSVSNEKRENSDEMVWNFGFDFINDKIVKVFIYCKPDSINEKNVKSELSGILQISADNIITVNNELPENEEYFPFEADCGRLLPSIDEKV